MDYLLPHGGLIRPICISFSPNEDPHEIRYIPGNGGEVPEVSYAPGSEDATDAKLAATIFAPLHDSLDAYTQILANGGSVAVGTGYRSVARRLLERVEALFARDIGLPWGETLEWLRGKRRRERLPVLPVLPVRGLLKKGASGLDDGETPTILGNNYGEEEPCQTPAPPPVLQPPPADGQGVHQMLAEGEKIRTKTKVEEWLEETETVLSTTINNNTSGGVTLNGPSQLNGKSNDAAGSFYVTLANQFNSPHHNQHPQAHNIQQDAASTVSQEEEEEKLVSGIILELLNESLPQKDLYAQYLADNALLEQTMLALRRLYPAFPAHTISRSIAALYLLLHPDLHHVLEAIARITKGELDLLNSGRFDGFLDEKDVIPADEEKELEALEVLDGNIFRTMEKLEDEIEALHVRAEEVRRKLRVRKEAIARKMVLAGKDKDTGGGGGGGGGGGVPITGTAPAEQFGPSLTRQNSTPMNAMIKHVQLPPPPPKSDYFEGLDKESTLNPIMPDDSASNYGSRHRRRTTRKATTSALAGEEGDLARRNSSGSGGSNNVGTAAQHLMKKQLEREKDKRDKERNREKYEKERERREKEERRKAKLVNAAANIGNHHPRGDSASPVLPPPYTATSTGDQFEKDKLAGGGSPLGPKRKKSSSKDDHKEKERDKRERHRSPERPTTSGKKGLENPPSRELMSPPPGTAGGTTMVATSPPTLLEDMLALKDRSSKDKKKEKSKEEKDRDKRKDIDDNSPITAEESKEAREKRRFSLKFPKFLSSDHDTSAAPGESEQNAAAARPGTSGSIRPTTAQSTNTAFTNASNATATATAIGGDMPTSGKHRKSRHHSHHRPIPEAEDEGDDGDEKIIRHHHTTRRRSSRRPTSSSANNGSGAVSRAVAMEVLSEPEDMFVRDEKPQYNISGVFSDDEGAVGGFGMGGGGSGGIKQQLVRKSLRRSSESKKVGRDAGAEGATEKEKEKERSKGKDRDREEKKERKRAEEERERDRERDRARRHSVNEPTPVLGTAPPQPQYPPPPPPPTHAAPVPHPAMVPLPGDSFEGELNPPVSDMNDNNSKRKSKEKKPEYKPSFSSSAGEGGNNGGGGVSLLGLHADGVSVGGIPPAQGELSRTAALTFVVSGGKEDDTATLAVTEGGTTMVGSEGRGTTVAGERSRTPRMRGEISREGLPMERDEMRFGALRERERDRNRMGFEDDVD